MGRALAQLMGHGRAAAQCAQEDEWVQRQAEKRKSEKRITEVQRHKFDEEPQYGNHNKTKKHIRVK
jgi:hypothetical protein